MQVTRITSLAELDSLAPDWNRLAGDVPFRTCEWMHSWWRHYGCDAEDNSPTASSLYVLVVRDGDGTIVGIAPWYVARTAISGRVVRFLGSGEVCSDYLSLLVEPQHVRKVTMAIADWCRQQTLSRSADAFSSIELDGVAAADVAINHLINALDHSGFWVRRRSGPNFWRLDLPDTWDEYLDTLSRSHRKQLRRLDRNTLATDRTRVHTVRSAEDLARWWPIFKQLHQRRRESLDQRGCFSSRQFDHFFDATARPLLDQGILQLDILELDGQPVAAEYDLVAGDVVYAYQSGLEPARLADQPGRILQMAVIRRAIQEGRRAIDFLRGDEPYKAHWRAAPQPSLEVSIAPAGASSALRGGISIAGAGVKQWIKCGLEAAGIH